MAKILVADDNSNIQKMVGLALKDHGIEVVAVGNGEAAVRKISDIKPDLVLADVFMPVRNGYEVCKYVKEDPALAHIPVILLVGAFDPLDEQEAQRVGADGVLKKPFVPPDPLISMVKAALVRAGIAHAGFTPVSAQPPVEEVAPPPPVAKKPDPLPLPEEFPESFVEDLPAPVAALKIDSGSQPLAFGSLLETPGTEKVQEAADVTTAPPEMVLQRDWRAIDEENEEEEEPAASKSSWRRDAGSAGDDDAEDQAARPAGGWRDTVGTAGFEGPHALRRGDKGWTPTREQQDLSEAAGTQQTMTATLTATKEPLPVTPFAGDAWAAAISAGSQDKTAVAEAEKPVDEVRPQEPLMFHEAPPVVAEESAVREPEQTPYSSPVVSTVEAAPVVAPPIETPVVEPEKSSAASSWFSTPPSPWDAEAKKASQLASTWDTPVVATPNQPSLPVDAPAASSFEPATAPDEIEVVSETEVSAVIPPEAVETLREEASHAVEQAAQEAEHAGTPAGTADAPQDAMEHFDMDAVVAKVMDRMGSSRLQEVTREILKPVVEAIVREEMASKKH